MIALYIACKILFIVNVVGQLFILNVFLGNNYHAYGYDILSKMLRNEEWTPSNRFPRVTLCDFYIRKLANIHRYTVQCVLPINLFNEKIYIFIWFWFVFVALVTFLNMIIWLCRMSLARHKVEYIRHRLSEMVKQGLPEHEKVNINRFVLKYLRMDGMLVLRLIGMNANEIVVGEVIKELWLNFKSKGYLNRHIDPTAPPIIETNTNGYIRGGMAGREQI